MLLLAQKFVAMCALNRVGSRGCRDVSVRACVNQSKFVENAVFN